MENFPPIIFFLGIWILGIFFFFYCYKLSVRRKIIIKDLLLSKQRQNEEKYPRWYNFFNVLGEISFLIITIISIFIIPVGIDHIQKIFYNSDQSILIAHYTQGISIIPSMFIGMLIGGILINLIYQFFPKFNRYQSFKNFNHLVSETHGNLQKKEKEKMWKKSLLKINISKFIRLEWQGIFLSALIIWIVTIPVYILALDNYYRITKDGFAVNSFFSVIEKKYNWKDTKSTSIYTTTSKGEGYDELILKPRFEITTNNGKTIDLWKHIGLGSPSANDLIYILQELQFNHKRIDFKPLTSLQKKALLEYNQEAQNNVNGVFQYLDSLN